MDEEQFAKVNKDTVIGNIKGINVLRTEMFLETEYNLKKNIDSKIFYLEAPTGSGKSNTAFNLSFQLLKKSDYCKKIFYVYPFNTLVEQNMNSMEKIFGQNENIMSNIVVVNSITPYKVKNNSNINRYKDEKYAIADYQKILLDRQFLNYPIVLSTHITLFDTMFGRSKDSTFGFHQLCHSVIVLDEIQSYNNNKWGAMINFLKAYAQLLDIKIIIMSATLPNLELLTNNNAKAVRLINNREKYFNHRMFANRVKVNYELLNRKIGIAELEEHILQHKNKRILIEFIRKSSAEKFYAHISESAECPVRLITGDSSIQERKDIIADIENMQEVILVATQVIEAGVDIDMDIGYKDISRLDSEEQFIGRINRSCRKDGVLYFFNMDDAKGIYRGDVRVDTDNTLMNEEIRELLNSKDFYDYYEKYHQFPSMEETKKRLDCFRDLIAYRVVISLPQCHLKEGQDREKEELRYLYEIANVLPFFMEQRGFRVESAKGVRASSSDMLKEAVRPYYRDYISNEGEYGYRSLHITFYDDTAKCYMEVQLRTKAMDDNAEIGPANHLGYEKRQENERARRDVIPVGECRCFDEAYERGMRLQQLELAKLDVNMFSAANNSLINDGCGLYRGRLILPYEHLSRFQSDLSS